MLTEERIAKSKNWTAATFKREMFLNCSYERLLVEVCTPHIYLYSTYDIHWLHLSVF